MHRKKNRLHHRPPDIVAMSSYCAPTAASSAREQQRMQRFNSLRRGSGAGLAAGAGAGAGAGGAGAGGAITKSRSIANLYGKEGTGRGPCLRRCLVISLPNSKLLLPQWAVRIHPVVVVWIFPPSLLGLVLEQSLLLFSLSACTCHLVNCTCKPMLKQKSCTNLTQKY